MADYNNDESNEKKMKKIDEEYSKDDASEISDDNKTKVKELLEDYRGESSVGSYVSDNTSVSSISTLTGISQRTILSRMANIRRKKILDRRRQRRRGLGQYHTHENSKTTVFLHRFMVLVSFVLSCYVMDKSVSALFGLEDGVMQTLRGGGGGIDGSIAIRGYDYPSGASDHASYDGKPLPDSPPSSEVTVFAKLDFDWKTGKIIKDHSLNATNEKTTGAMLPRETYLKKANGSIKITSPPMKGSTLPTGTVTKGTPLPTGIFKKGARLPLTTTAVTTKREEGDVPSKASEDETKESSKANEKKEQAKDLSKANQNSHLSSENAKNHYVEQRSVENHYANFMKEEKIKATRKKKYNNISSDSLIKKPSGDKKEEPYPSKDELMHTVVPKEEEQEDDDDDCQSNCTDFLPRMSDLQATDCTLLKDYAQFCRRPAWEQYQLCQQSCSDNGYHHKKRCCPRTDSEHTDLSKIVEETVAAMVER